VPSSKTNSTITTITKDGREEENGLSHLRKLMHVIHPLPPTCR
jgi:hypothetical protein